MSSPEPLCEADWAIGGIGGRPHWWLACSYCKESLLWVTEIPTDYFTEEEEKDEEWEGGRESKQAGLNFWCFIMQMYQQATSCALRILLSSRKGRMSLSLAFGCLHHHSKEIPLNHRHMKKDHGVKTLLPAFALQLHVQPARKWMKEDTSGRPQCAS
jgi:hypothetical protein